jgi:high-affinity iron transporter
MLPSFILVFREGLEATLLISILFAALRQLKLQHQARAVWIGVIAAIVAALIGGIVIFLTIREFEGTAEQIFEAAAYLLAVAILTYVTFWMQRHSRTMKSEISAKMSGASSGFALAVLAFTSVGREAVETALFLVASAFETQAWLLIAGGLLGLLAAITLSYLIYRLGYRLNYRVFFLIMGILLIFFAAGLLINGVHELEELGVFPFSSVQAYDLSGILSRKSELGSLLKGIVGYYDTPSILQLVTYWGYLLIAGGLFLFISRKPVPATSRETSGVAARG